MDLRPARTEEYGAVTAILDGAMLDVDSAATRESIERGQTLVAVEGERVLGVAVCVPIAGEQEGVRIDAIAVRRRRRGQGIGTALVEAVAEREERVVARFDASVRPFYESLRFEIAQTESDEDGRERFRGVRK